MYWQLGQIADRRGLAQKTGEMIFWDFEDPKTRNVPMPFDATFRELNERLKMFVLVQTKKTLISE